MPANDMKTNILYVREKCYTNARRSYDVVNKAGVNFIQAFISLPLE